MEQCGHQAGCVHPACHVRSFSAFAYALFCFPSHRLPWILFPLNVTLAPSPDPLLLEKSNAHPLLNSARGLASNSLFSTILLILSNHHPHLAVTPPFSASHSHTLFSSRVLCVLQAIMMDMATLAVSAPFMQVSCSNMGYIVSGRGSPRRVVA
ncbi:hypothetical protein B0I35DRAFT_91550 [Stachybotrys elegans]|uniref:Uncharacterized protein n=1 Tax=Stachybotrys elegans TaxID=80388 RepID=A0A8K0SIK0_9HYPO|nr:hypothetical protein B0I35DRAFT_91550 [Stachybotrys elegans]